jgi:hypothetical protein
MARADSDGDAQVFELVGAEVTGHEVTGHEITGHEITGHEITGHEITGTALTDDGDQSAGEDVINAGSRPLSELALRGLRVGRARWAGLAPRRRFVTIAVIVLALIGSGVAIGLTRPSTHQPIAQPNVGPEPNPAPSPIGPSPVSTYDPNADTASAVGPAFVAPGSPVRDVAVASNDLYVVGATAVSVVDSYSRGVLRQAPVASSVGARVVLDPASGTFWDVDIATAPAQAREFDMATLRLTRTVAVLGVVYTAAELDSRLYLATSGGVYLVAPGSTTLTAVATSIPAIQAISIDPEQHTVLGLTSGATARIITIGDEGATVRAGSTINVANPTIAVMNDALWVGSVGTGARLERFDESTLRPLPEGAGGVVVEEGADRRFALSAGVADLWVYESSAQTLYCVDSHSGAVLQRWTNITQSVATGGSGPFAVSSGTVVPLVLRGNCQG